MRGSGAFLVRMSRLSRATSGPARGRATIVKGPLHGEDAHGMLGQFSKKSVGQIDVADALAGARGRVRRALVHNFCLGGGPVGRCDGNGFIAQG